MAGPISAYPSVPFRRLIVERLADVGPPLPAALLSVARLLQKHGVAPPLRYADDPPRPIEQSDAALNAYLSEVRRARSQGIPKIFRLAAAERNPGFALFLEFEPTPRGEIATLWFSLPATRTVAAPEIEQLMRVFADVCPAFAGYHGALEDERLLVLYRGARAAERARELVPPELRQFVPVSPLSVGASGKLPNLLVPQEFDRRRVPDAVWWINFWDVVQVETVGASRIRTAGFARVTEQPCGGMVLVSTREPTDPANPAHLQQLSRIVEHLQLRTLQEAHRLVR